MQRRDFLLWGSQSAFLTALSLSSATASSILLQSCSQQGQNPEPTAADLEKLIPKLMADAKVPGLSLAIVRNGKLTWCKGFGVKGNLSKELVNEDTVFEAASVSKTIFAYAVMKLCEKGVIGLDIPLVEYSSKRFLEGDPRLDLITARHVLSHRSGFQNWRAPNEPLKINFTPGSDFLYSGEGYFYLQSVITELTGTTNLNDCGTYEAGLKVCSSDIGEYLIRNVLIPLGMRSSGYAWTDTMLKNEAIAHDINGKSFSKPHQTAIDMARYASAGGLLTTAKDYGTFISGLFTAKDNDAFLLNRNSLMEMVRPQVRLREEQKIDGASSWALGWAVLERPEGNVILHSGGQPGFRSLAMASLEKKSGFVMLTNSDGGGYVLFNEKLGNILDRLFT